MCCLNFVGDLPHPPLLSLSPPPVFLSLSSPLSSPLLSSFLFLKPQLLLLQWTANRNCTHSGCDLGTFKSTCSVIVVVTEFIVVILTLNFNSNIEKGSITPLLLLLLLMLLLLLLFLLLQFGGNWVAIRGQSGGNSGAIWGQKGTAKYTNKVGVLSCTFFKLLPALQTQNA